MTEDYDGYVSKLSLEKEAAYQKTIKRGEVLRQKRKKLSKILESDIITELKLLDLEKVQFRIHFDESTSVLYEDGLDVVTFNISLNEGEPLKPLYKTASGGEFKIHACA